MGEMGLTQDVGEEGLKFEVWVRHASRTRDCITLQAKDREGKVAWTHDVAHLLWTHAINNTGTWKHGRSATAGFDRFRVRIKADVLLSCAAPRAVSEGVPLRGHLQQAAAGCIRNSGFRAGLHLQPE